jgi:hypothetical protein
MNNLRKLIASVKMGGGPSDQKTHIEQHTYGSIQEDGYEISWSLYSETAVDNYYSYHIKLCDKNNKILRELLLHWNLILHSYFLTIIPPWYTYKNVSSYVDKKICILQNTDVDLKVLKIFQKKPIHSSTVIKTELDQYFNSDVSKLIMEY